MNGPAVSAVLFDLDDTLYPQSSFLAGAFDAVAEEAGRLGLERGRFRRALDEALLEGSDKGNTIDRALAAAGAPGADATVLVKVFQDFVPARLDPYPGVRAALAELGRHVPLGLVTDGHVPGQRAKLEATGLGPHFEVVVFSDEIGRRYRKPHPAGVDAALERLGVPPLEAVLVGDRPDKDVAVALRLEMRAVRVRTGEHAASPDLPGTFASVGTVAAAAALLLPLVSRAD